MNTTIAQLTGSIPATSRTNKFALEPEAEAMLDAFVDWLRATGKTEATSRSYRSYCAKALSLGQSWTDMTSDQRSAVRKLAEFTDTLEG